MSYYKKDFSLSIESKDFIKKYYCSNFHISCSMDCDDIIDIYNYNKQLIDGKDLLYGFVIEKEVDKNIIDKAKLLDNELEQYCGKENITDFNSYNFDVRNFNSWLGLYYYRKDEQSYDDLFKRVKEHELNDDAISFIRTYIIKPYHLSDIITKEDFFFIYRLAMLFLKGYDYKVEGKAIKDDQLDPIKIKSANDFVNEIKFCKDNLLSPSLKNLNRKITNDLEPNFYDEQTVKKYTVSDKFLFAMKGYILIYYNNDRYAKEDLSITTNLFNSMIRKCLDYIKYNPNDDDKKFYDYAYTIIKELFDNIEPCFEIDYKDIAQRLGVSYSYDKQKLEKVFILPKLADDEIKASFKEARYSLPIDSSFFYSPKANLEAKIKQMITSNSKYFKYSQFEIDRYQQALASLDDQFFSQLELLYINKQLGYEME